MRPRLRVPAFWTAVFVLCAGSASAQVVPVADYHQHLFSPRVAELLSAGSGGPRSLTARDLVALLDAARIRRALVLSVGYMYGSPARTVSDEYAKVRAENDWTAAQAGEYPERLRAFFSVNPLRDYALDEIARCAKTPDLRHGMKLHFGNSDVRLDDPAHVAQLQRVFKAANEHRLALVVHVRANISNGRPYGAEQARVFLEQVLPQAPDVPIQIAHMAGTGPGYDDPPADAAVGVLAEAVASGDPRTKQLWFDVTTCADSAISPANAERLARRIRQVGVGRVLYGSDAAVGGNLPPREGWAAFRRLPLTDEEFATIAGNVAPQVGEPSPPGPPR